MWDKELLDLVLATAPELMPRVVDVGDVGIAILAAWIDAREYWAELRARPRLGCGETREVREQAATEVAA